MALTALSGLFLIFSVLLWLTAVLGWTRVHSPAVDWFARVAGMAGSGAFALCLGFLADSHVFVVFVTIVTGLLLPIPWVLFTFEYIGQEELTTLSTAVILSLPLAVGLFSTVIIFGGQVFTWVPLPTRETATGISAILLSVFSLSQFLALLYAGGVMLVGGGLILRTFQRYPHLDSTTGIAIVTFGTVPWISLLFGLQIEATSFVAFGVIVAIGFAFGTLSGMALVGPAPLFRRVPAAGSIGPSTVVEELNGSVVVTDRNGTVVELNAAAKQLFDSEAVGQSASDVFGVALEDLREQTVLELAPESGRILLEPTVSELTDQHEHVLGYAVVFRDVTTRTIRQQRLNVFNRVLRHNLRNDLSVVSSHGETIQQRTDDESIAESTASILDASERLLKISRNVRSAEKALTLEPGGDDGTRLHPLIEGMLETLAEEYDGEFEYEVPKDIVVSLPEEQLDLVLSHLVENALEHNDSDTPSVRVTVRYDAEAAYPLRLSVIDNGPGIPELERQVIETGDETALAHTSGVGLWIVRWTVTSVGGNITFAEREPRGSIVSIDFPTAPETDASPSR